MNNKSGFNLSEELGALANIAGLGASSSLSSSDSLLERATAREFILDMKQKFALDQDPYFNTYDPNYKDPFWKKLIKELIGWQKTEKEKGLIIDHNITKAYQSNVEFDLTDSGAIHIYVTHVDPKKASSYANNFMEELRRLVEEESISAQSLRLNYLSETLADALQEMERTEANLKNYALKNSARAQENFISDSLQLDKIRMEKRQVAEIADLLSIMQSLVEGGSLDNSSYQELRTNYPLVDDISFRRILGMSETISSWTWPDIETIKAVSATLRDRIIRLNVDIKNIEENAKIYAVSAEDLAKFTRDAKIAEATYTVLIEQVKSQSLAAGFQQDNFKVFQYATPPIVASSPQRNLILVLGGLIGIFLSCSTALVSSVLKGVYFTKSSLLKDVSAELVLKSKSIRRLAQKPITQMLSFFENHSVIALDEAAMKLANKNLIFVHSSVRRPSASDATILLAVQNAQSGRNILLCDTTGQSEKRFGDKLKPDNSGIDVVDMGNKLSLMVGANGASFFTSSNFKQTIKGLMDQFDQVYLCSSSSNIQIALMALEEFSPALVLVASLRKTKKLEIKTLKTKLPVEILFYE